MAGALVTWDFDVVLLAVLSSLANLSPSVIQRFDSELSERSLPLMQASLFSPGLTSP